MKRMTLKWIFFLVGLVILGLGIAMTIKGKKLGIGPWDVLHVGLYKNFGLTIGTWSIIMGFLLVFVTALWIKSWPQIGTWINMVVVGLFIDFFNWLLPDTDQLLYQIIYFIAGVLIMGYGVGIYIAGHIGAGPRDQLMLVLVDKTKWSIRTIRTIIEIVVAIFGWLLGGPIGIGTFIIAFLLGPIVHVILPQSERLLTKLAKNE